MAKLNVYNMQRNSGLTILGVLVATIIFAFMLLATFSLMARTTKEVGRSREEFIATNLATEGLELVRYIRDTNWLSGGGTSWTGNGSAALCSGNETYDLAIDRDLINSTVRVTQIPIPDDIPAKTRLFLKQHSSPLVENYEHDPTGIPSTSVYSRLIKINCAEFDNAGTLLETGESTPANEHIIVTSIVTWHSRGQAHEVSLREHLYNWYQ